MLLLLLLMLMLKITETKHLLFESRKCCSTNTGIKILFLHNVGSPAQNEICCVWRRIENQQKRSIGQQLQTTYSSLFFLGTTDDE